MSLLACGRAELDRVAATVEATGGSALVVPGDAAEEGTAARAVEATLARFGRLDCLVQHRGPVPLL
jgi:NAD(P)-dependent dehydrogenase (short-subunit alcohol dehydrogenase family)